MTARDPERPSRPRRAFHLAGSPKDVRADIKPDATFIHDPDGKPFTIRSARSVLIASALLRETN